MSTVILKGYIEVPTEELNVVTNALVEHARLTEAEPGCLVFKVSKHSTISNRFDVYEEFEDQKAFEHHQQRVLSSEWGQLTVNVRRFYDVVIRE
ncbi:putative quinol monooxygenase [Vibrio maritimus]|uniref:putative quinol monooxygenase n=1 Tax=Vibrio maritimus TaxID=990268 RepID=UPI001F23DFAA|nr:antibiotic biosynthesis monooxygenase [Vibrio maritimus]